MIVKPNDIHWKPPKKHFLMVPLNVWLWYIWLLFLKKFKFLKTAPALKGLNALKEHSDGTINIKIIKT
jgi:hypothetical protein